MKIVIFVIGMIFLAHAGQTYQSCFPGTTICVKAEKESDTLGKFNIEDGKYKYLYPKWGNTGQPAHLPHLYTTTFDEKHTQHVIVLTKEYGTDLLLQEAHVLEKTKERIREIKLINPLVYMDEHITFETGNEKLMIRHKDKVWKGSYHKKDMPVVGNWVRYEVHQHEIKVYIGVQKDPLHYVGQMVLTYRKKGDVMRVEKVEYEKQKNTLEECFLFFVVIHFSCLDFRTIMF